MKETERVSTRTRGLKGVSQESLKGVSRESLKRVSRESLKRVSRESQESQGSLSRESQESLKSLKSLSESQESLKSSREQVKERERERVSTRTRGSQERVVKGVSQESQGSLSPKRVSNKLRMEQREGGEGRKFSNSSKKQEVRCPPGHARLTHCYQHPTR